MRFSPDHGVIVVPCEIVGPRGSVLAELALDTGAVRTVVRTQMLATIGCDIENAPRTQLITASGIEQVARTEVIQLSALNRTIRNAQVLAHDLPDAARLDGVLGLDFFHNTRLTIDFRKRTIELD